MHQRGIRVLPGGDYGFPWNPVGRNARDIEHFVNLFGFAPAKALRAATQFGGQIMGMGGELGLVREGFLADLLLDKGDPVGDVRLHQDPREPAGHHEGWAVPQDAPGVGAHPRYDRVLPSMIERAVRLAAGLVSGKVAMDGASAYLGIPFAAPPIGPLR
jgi:Carboxylesterase family